MVAIHIFFTCGLSLFPATTLVWYSGLIMWLWDSSNTLLCSSNFFSHSAVPPRKPGPPLGQTVWSLDQRVRVLGCESSVSPLEESGYFWLNVTLFIGAAEGTGTSVADGARESAWGRVPRSDARLCDIFDMSSFNSILIMSSWIFSASYSLNKLLSVRLQNEIARAPRIVRSKAGRAVPDIWYKVIFERIPCYKVNRWVI